MSFNEGCDFVVNGDETIPKVTDVWSLPKGFHFIFLDKRIFAIVFDKDKHMPVMAIERVSRKQLEAVRNEPEHKAGNRKPSKNPKVDNYDGHHLLTVTKNVIKRNRLDKHLGHLAARGNYPEQDVKLTDVLTNMILQHLNCISWTKLERWIRERLKGGSYYNLAYILSAPICSKNAEIVNDKTGTFVVPDILFKMAGFDLANKYSKSVRLWYLFQVPNDDVNSDSFEFMEGSSKIRNTMIKFRKNPIWIIRPDFSGNQINNNSLMIEIFKEFCCSDQFPEAILGRMRSTFDASNGDIFVSPDPRENGLGFKAHYSQLVALEIGGVWF